MVQYEEDHALRLNAYRRENVTEHAPDYPYAALISNLVNFAGRCASWHWHKHFEFMYVTQGTVIVHTQRGVYRICEGEGCFVNANVLHLCQAGEDCDSVYVQTQQFDREVIAGTGLVARRYVAPIETCAALDALRLSPEVPAEREILDCILQAFAAAEAAATGCEMRISAALTNAWQRMFVLVEPVLETSEPSSRNEVSRAKTMLSFIYDHFAEDIALADIAAAGGVSTRECFRCFKQILDTTPLNYLTSHRVGVAARLLVSGDLSVDEIAQSCGFAGASYFGKVFHRVMGCTPSAYRKRSRKISQQ